MREVPKSFNYHPLAKAKRGTGLIALPNGKKVEDWIIRRLFLNPICKDMEYVPTTTRKVDEAISNR
jgi:hypothetical protein